MNKYATKYFTTDKGKASRQRYNVVRKAQKLDSKVKLAGRAKPDTCEVPGCTRTDVVFDHDHKTGKFRGWICNGCNTALGYIRDNPDVLRSLASYLEVHVVLSEAVSSFEARFGEVLVDEKGQYRADLPILWSGGPRTFEESSWALFATREDAVSQWWKSAVSSAKGTGVLRWIVKPELLEFQITIADRIGRHRAVNNRFAVKSQFTTES